VSIAGWAAVFKQRGAQTRPRLLMGVFVDGVSEVVILREADIENRPELVTT
jgi:chemotaxis signal transduction protein